VRPEDTVRPGRPEDTVRPARPEDADAVAGVHVASWQVAYRGLLPDDYLAAQSVEERSRQWSETLSDPTAGLVVVTEVDSRVVGFAHIGLSGDADAARSTGELHAIYLHPDAWDRGLGRDLHGAALNRLRGAGYRTATLWMLATNDRARRFYLRHGWSQRPGERSQTFGGQVVTDHRFGRPLGAAPVAEEQE
jgi:GNAT superfamily N-acetyltransferase